MSRPIQQQNNVSNGDYMNDDGYYTNSNVRAFLKNEKRVFGQGCDSTDEFGNWITDDCVMAFLEAIGSEPIIEQGRLQTRLQNYTYKDVKTFFFYITSKNDSPQKPSNQNLSVFYEFTKNQTREDMQKYDVVIVVNDITKQHYFPILIDFGEHPTSSKPNIYVYDTLSHRTNDFINKLLKLMFPSWKEIINESNVYNRTNDIKQTGATCGVWSLWIIMVFVANIRGWRTRRTNQRRPIFHTSIITRSYDIFGKRSSRRDKDIAERFWSALNGKLYDDEQRNVDNL